MPDATWTTALPDKPGWYWIAYYPTEVVEIDDQQRVWWVGEDGPGKLGDFEGCLWSGPLEPPGGGCERD